MAIETQLDALEAKGLIRLAASQPELEYLFRHWLVQDTAYESLLKQERRQLHRVVGEALEALYPQRREELAGILGMHFEQAGEKDKALEYLVAAGNYALDRNAIREAFSAFDRAAALLPPPSGDEDEAVVRRRVEIEIGRGRSGWAFRAIDEIIGDLEAILPQAELLGDLELIAPIHLTLALSRLQSGDPASDPAVRRSLDRVAEIAEALHDPALRALPLALIGLSQVFSGSLREGVRTLEEAIPLMEQRQDFIGASFARGALAIGYANLGEFDKAELAVRNASELAASGDLIAQLDASIAESMVRSARGQLDEAVPLAQACVRRSEETGATACVVASSWVLGDAYQRQGLLQEARQALERGHEVALVVDRRMWRPTLQAWLASTTTALGDSAGDEQWEEALETSRSIGNRMGEGGILWKRAETAAQGRDWARAFADFEASSAIAEEIGARPNLARILRAWGEALRAAGHGAEAASVLRRSLDLFRELGLTGEATAVSALLDLETAQQPSEGGA